MSSVRKARVPRASGSSAIALPASFSVFSCLGFHLQFSTPNAAKSTLQNCVHFGGGGGVGVGAVVQDVMVEDVGAVSGSSAIAFPASFSVFSCSPPPPPSGFRV